MSFVYFFFVFFFAYFFYHSLALTRASYFKDDLLGILNVQERRLEKAMDDYNKRGFRYFVVQLNETKNQIEFLKKEIDDLPESANDMSAEYLALNTRTLVYRASAQILRPAPDEMTKADVLYLAAIKFVENDLKSLGDMMSGLLRIINHETQYKALNSSDTTALEELEKILRSEYRPLMDMLKGADVPTPDDNVQLVKVCLKKLQYFADHNNNGVEAKKWRYEVNNFESLTYQLAALLPIDNEIKIQQGLTLSTQHYRLLLELKNLASLVQN